MIKKIMALGFLMTSSAFSAESLLEGTWLTKEQKATVEITKCNDNNALYCGKIIGLKEPFEEDGSAKVDKHNEDKSLRTRPIIGINIIENFKKESDTEYDDGRIYNPEDGNDYDSDIEFKDNNTIKVSGCVLSFLCKTQIWTRKIN